MKIIKFNACLFLILGLCGCGNSTARESRAISITFNGTNSSGALIDITSHNRFIVILAKVTAIKDDKEKLLSGSSIEAKYNGSELYETLSVYLKAVTQKENPPSWFEDIRLSKNITIMKRESKGRVVKFYIDEGENIWIVAAGDNWGDN